jgi:Holliday junction resolvase-like predicted endonuclease
MFKSEYDSEQVVCRDLHLKNTPVLISSQLLRRYDCGQVDVSYVKDNVLHLVEVKSSQVGVSNYFTKQYLRMMRSAKLLTSLVQMPIKLKIIAKR